MAEKYSVTIKEYEDWADANKWLLLYRNDVCEEWQTPNGNNVFVKFENGKIKYQKTW